jgi:hypothetical protein
MQEVLTVIKPPEVFHKGTPKINIELGKIVSRGNLIVRLLTRNHLYRTLKEHEL